MTNPIASITSQQLMRRALTGAVAGDPVLPDPPRRPRRGPRSRTTRSDRMSG